MASLLKQVFILGLLIFLELPSHVSGEVTVYGLLSLSIFEIKTDIENIKRRIENLEKKVEGTCISTTVSPQFEGRAIKEEEIMDIKEAMNVQALAIQKTLTAEKLLLRETVETFESKFADFESKIQKDIASINASIEGKAEAMFDTIQSSSKALANGTAELTSELNYTTNDIRQSLKAMETTMMSNVRVIETRLIANITMIQNQSATKSTLSSLQANLNSLDSTVTSISYNQTHFIEPELTSLSSQISSVSTSLSSRISSLESSTRYIAFHAYNPRNWSPREGEIVVFQNVYLNAGEGYDTTNGIFRAPVRGLYHFTAHICHAQGKLIAFGIYVGGQMIARSTLTSDQSACGSVTAVTIMDMGQTVTVRGNFHNNWLTADYHRQPSFIGVLIRA